MSVSVTKTTGHTAEITWEPKADDPHGYLARAVEGDQLAFALETLGNQDANREGDADRALNAAMHTAELARLLERRAAVQVVQLRDEHGLSWRRISSAIFEDPFKQSSVRRMYDSGRRHLGTGGTHIDTLNLTSKDDA
ncbi:hypothetical protein [Streptomyces sp. BH104]|uniref:hypothetical protein n=1 Tax=unclassified Streptomyces TaxID=2593676 RepID=UPI003BB7CC40